ncbi:MAG: thiol-activated cytolysin family protein [Bacteroidota bacterium]
MSNLIKQSLLTLFTFLLLSVATATAQEAVALQNKWQKFGGGKNIYLAVSGNKGTTVSGTTPSTGMGWILIRKGDFYQIQSQSNPNHYLHLERGPVEVGPIQPGWWSAQWAFEPAGNGFRIRNRWRKNQYLHIQNPQLTAGAMQPNWWSAIWLKTPHRENAERAATTPPLTAGRNGINNYLRSLSYDPRRLLSVSEEGGSQALPAERSTTSNSVIICRNEPKKLDKKMDKISILKPTSGVIYPGALVQANRNLAEGLPTPITLPRAPLTLRVDLPGLTNNGTVTIQNPQNSNVQSAINNVLEEWNRNPASQGYVNPSNTISRIEKAYTSEQVSLALGFRADWASNSVSAATKMNTSSEKSVTVAFFQQVFYTVTMDAPQRPADVFGASVSLADVRGVVNNSNPAAYVRSIDYGRTIMVRMETNLQKTDVELEAAMKYATAGGTKFTGDLKAKYENITKNSVFTVYSIGGNAEVASEVIAGTDLTKLKSVIEKDAVYRRNNPGVPIAYTTAFLKDNSVAKISSTSEYTETNCTEYPNGYIKFEHAGAYVAKFTVTWIEKNAQGIPIPKIWNSGQKTSGYTKTVNIPGDAKDVHVSAVAATGLVWDPWGEIMKFTINGPTNCTYRAYGTTLNRKYEKKDCAK